jgi:hypothetical protein
LKPTSPRNYCRGHEDFQTSSSARFTGYTGGSFKPGNLKGPRYVGRLINKFVYEPLPPGVLQELKRVNPPNEKGYRKYKHHQFLTPDIGNPHLEKQIIEVTTLMRVADDKREFEGLFGRAFPNLTKRGQQLGLDYPGEAEARKSSS